MELVVFWSLLVYRNGIYNIGFCVVDNQLAEISTGLVFFVNDCYRQFSVQCPARIKLFDKLDVFND